MPRKKKKKVEAKKLGLESLGGYNSGDVVYCHRYPDKSLARGRIIRFFSCQQDFAEIIDDVSGQFRATLLEDIIDDPSRSQIASVNSKITWKKRVIKDKKKKSK